MDSLKDAPNPAPAPAPAPDAAGAAEPLETGLEFGANADQVVADVAARNMAAIVATTAEPAPAPAPAPGVTSTINGTAPHVVYFVHPAASRTSKVVSKEAMARIGKKMLALKGVSEDEVNKLRVYQHAAEGRVHVGGSLYERRNWKSLAAEKGDKQNGCKYRVYTMRKFLEGHFPQCGLHDWNPDQQVGVPDFDDAVKWPAFYEAWVKPEQRPPKKRPREEEEPSTGADDTSDDGICSETAPGAIDLATQLLEKLQGELAGAAPDSATRTALQEAIEKVGSVVKGLDDAAFADQVLSEDDRPEQELQQLFEVQATPVDAPAYRVGGDDAGEGTAGFCALGGDDGEGEGQARFCALDSDDAQASAPQRAPGGAAQRVLALLRRQPGSELEQRLAVLRMLALPVGAARAP